MTQAAQLAQYGSNNVGLSFKNRIINGDMGINQRALGTTTINSGSAWVYTIDRWSAIGESASGVYTLQQSTTAPAGFTNSFLATVTTPSTITAGNIYVLRQIIEGFNTADLGFGTASASAVTLSFWVRSSVTGTFGGVIKNGANNRSYPFTYAISSANTFEYKTVTIAGDTTGTWATNNTAGLQVFFSLGTGSAFLGTAGAWAGSDLYGATGQTNIIPTNGATFFITGVQLEKGSTATSFDYLPYGTELALCQRYFQVFSRWEECIYGGSTGVSGGGAALIFQQVMRAAPTITFAPAGNSAGTIAFLGASGSYPSTIGTHSAVSVTTYGARMVATGYTNAWSGAGIVTALYAQTNNTNVYTASAEL